ncbi:hypothetical protein [Streptomyces sp. WM6372]|uniref:hypothetical protein n=1 Tax=Streptomyces sp. WM6372 TaxID=1415555 RepID=UPI00131CB26E|nr:hypothetical protein [Streptomyces sp. WM6372]
MTSADRLSVKAAAAAWPGASGRPEEQDRFGFARPDGAEVGSVLDSRMGAIPFE